MRVANLPTANKSRRIYEVVKESMDTQKAIKARLESDGR